MMDGWLADVPMRSAKSERPENDIEERPSTETYHPFQSEELVEAVNTLAKKTDFLPRPNIYRCFALRFPASDTDKFLVFACMMVQVLGALIVYDYSHRVGQASCYENIYTHVGQLTESMAKQYNRRNDGLAFLANCFYFPAVRKLIEMKLLGGILLCMVFLTLTRNLTQQAADAEYLMIFFYMRETKEVKWLLVDVVCNSLCYLIIALTVGTFLAFEGTVVDVILDSMGLFFLANIDTLSSDIAYSMTNDHFVKLVSLAHSKWLSRYASHRTDMYAPLDGTLIPDEIQAYKPRESSALWMIQLFRACTACARFLNQVIICVQLNVFLQTSRVEIGELHKKVGFGQAWRDGQFSLLPAVILWTMITASEIKHHYAKRAKSNRQPLRPLELFSHVVLRTNDYPALYHTALTDDISEAELGAKEQEQGLEERLQKLEEILSGRPSKVDPKTHSRESCARHSSSSCFWR